MHTHRPQPQAQTLVRRARKPLLAVVLLPHVSYLLLLLLASLAFSFTGKAHAGDAVAEHPVFSEAPAPEAIASILFPPRYRSVEPAAESSTPKPLFSMVINFAFDSADILPESEPMLQVAR